MRKDLLCATVAIAAFTLICGLAYPLVVSGLARVLFGAQASGSLVQRDGRVVGSRLIGQDFAQRAGAFQSRPSVTGYDPSATFFNNRGPNQASLAVQQRRFALDYASRERIPVALVPTDAATTAASGVDPHISARNARIQAARVARARRLALGRVLDLVAQHTDGRGLGLFGEPGVNVLELNLAVDREASR